MQSRLAICPRLWRGALQTLLLVSVALLLQCKERQKAPEQGGQVLRITGIPDENPTEIARNHKSLVRYLEEKLSLRVQYTPVTDYGAAVQALAAGKVDIAWLGGFTHVQARRLAEVEPLCMRAIDRKFHSVFIASREGGVSSLEDLRGKTLAFGSKSSTSGHLMPRHFLSEKFGIDVSRDLSAPPVYSGAHDATVKMVEANRVSVGALNSLVWERMVRDGSVDTEKVRVIWTTPDYVDYVWTARTALPEELRTRFTEAFLSLDKSNQNHSKILSQLGAESYLRAKPADFDAIEAIAKESGLLEKH